MAVIDAVIEEKARAALQVLAGQARVRAAYLFGSRVDGTADRWSDIDLAAFIETGERWDLKRRVAVCAEARRQAGDDVELHLFPAAALDNPPRASLAQHVLKHGVALDFDDPGALSA